jgi:GH15 family glucan-1,4-alpha-glucosidase
LEQKAAGEHQDPGRHAQGKYKPIEDYGVIGDLHSVALVSTDGSIDWCCLPHFASPSVFAAILDAKKGGYFRISPEASGTVKQMYLPDTNVLVTHFLCPDGVGECVDFMPVRGAAGEDKENHDIVRQVKVIRGSLAFKLECFPAFNYARDRHRLRLDENGAVFESHGARLGLSSQIKLHAAGDGVEAGFMLQAGETIWFLLRHSDQTSLEPPTQAVYDGTRVFHETVEFWRRWAEGIQYRGRWREVVTRSALALKLLTFAPTGAIVAAPTTSLPEEIGGVRNWDYRYTWIRDAAFTVYGLVRLGLTFEAERFVDWIDERSHELNPDGSLQVLYGINGEHDLPEMELPHLEGYKGSAPVRIGNQAANQLQLDIYGELLDSVYLAGKYGKPISYETWQYLRRLIDYVVDHWQEKDEGIWEIRGERQHMVSSKMMCWVALDRGLRLATKRSFPAPRHDWLDARDSIFEDVMERGWNHRIKSFVQHYDTEALDASSLLMPLTFFISPYDPRMEQTLDAIMGSLVSDSLVYRYLPHETPDGLPGEDGAFNMCTFWLVEALTRAGRLGEARLMFEKMLGYANHLGLYSEETGESGQALGNFPQAFTHMGLISAAFNLNRALGE